VDVECARRPLLAKLGGDFRCVGCSGAKDNLGIGRKVVDGVDQVSDTFLACNAADEEDVGHGGVDSIIRQSRGLFGLPVLGKIDAVVDDVNSAWIDIGVRGLNVGLGALGYGNDGIRIQDRGALHPGTHGVA